MKRAIDTIGISLDIKEETRKWIEEHPNVFQDIMSLYRLRVYQVRLTKNMAEVYKEDKLVVPRWPPWIVKCRVNLFDYIDISC